MRKATRILTGTKHGKVGVIVSVLSVSSDIDIVSSTTDSTFVLGISSSIRDRHAATRRHSGQVR